MQKACSKQAPWEEGCQICRPQGRQRSCCKQWSLRVRTPLFGSHICLAHCFLTPHIGHCKSAGRESRGLVWWSPGRRRVGLWSRWWIPWKITCKQLKLLDTEHLTLKPCLRAASKKTRLCADYGAVCLESHILTDNGHIRETILHKKSTHGLAKQGGVFGWCHIEKQERYLRRDRCEAWAEVGWVEQWESSGISN